MHRSVNQANQGLITDKYGAGQWTEIQIKILDTEENSWTKIHGRRALSSILEIYSG